MASGAQFPSAVDTTAARHMKTVLALETSCDETAVAVLRRRDDHSGNELLASEVASQVAAHEKFGGVVPEVASRNHLIYAPPLLDRAMSTAKIDLSNVDAFAATSGPGLASSLMIGASALASLISRLTISKGICSLPFSVTQMATSKSGQTFRSL